MLDIETNASTHESGSVSPTYSKVKSNLEDVIYSCEETDRGYELAITKLIDSAWANSRSHDLECTLKGFISDVAQSPSIRYAAFYALTIYLRRRSRFEELFGLFAQHRSDFNEHPTFRKCELIACVAAGVPHNPDAYILEADRIAASQATSAGSLHLYAAMVAVVGESNRALVDDAALDNALRRCEEAIRLDSKYPKFYATKSRLQKLLGDFDGALISIDKAIGLADPDEWAYAVLVSSFGSLRVDIVFEIQRRSLIQMEEEQRAQLERSSVRTIELVGFFAAVVALVVAGAEVIGGQTFVSAACLILVLCGAIILSYLCLVVLIGHSSQDEDSKHRIHLIILLAIVLILSGFVAGMRTESINVDNTAAANTRSSEERQPDSVRVDQSRQSLQ